MQAFPGKFSFVGNIGSPGDMTVEIVDPELKSILGKYIIVTFNMGSWSVLESISEGEIILRSKDTKQPIMVIVPFGQGKIFYTCSHNHTQTSDAETSLLKLMVFKQISAVVNLPLQQLQRGSRVGIF
jgi:hypothetical protein